METLYIYIYADNSIFVVMITSFIIYFQNLFWRNITNPTFPDSYILLAFVFFGKTNKLGFSNENPRGTPSTLATAGPRSSIFPNHVLVSCCLPHEVAFQYGLYGVGGGWCGVVVWCGVVGGSVGGWKSMSSVNC